jgi:hypothetical protein
MAKETSNKPGSTVGLPKSEKMAGGERVGIDNTGYLTTKGLEAPNGKSPMPPGMNIENQMNADINPMETKTYSGGMGYPGDGWT